MPNHDSDNAGFDTSDVDRWIGVPLGGGTSLKLNGELVCEMDADEFDQPGERAIEGDHKYKLKGEKRAVKDFARKGYLGFQDHGHPVWYKNVKLLPLTEK